MSRGRFQRKRDEPDPEKDELSEDELVLHSAQALPDRAAMSTLDADIAIPVNPALAADVLSGMDEGEDAEAGQQERPDQDSSV